MENFGWEEESLRKSMAILNSSEDDSSWKDIKYVIFDMVIPNVPYENRMEELKKLKLPSHVSVVDIKLCLGNDDLMKYLNTIVSNGGEGIVVTKPQSFYVPERTRTRLKVR